MAKKVRKADEYEDEGDGVEDSESSDDEEDEAEEVLQQQPRPNAVYNSIALHEKLEEIGWPDDLDWLQTLCIDYPVEEGDIDVNDDLAREMAFYTQALEGSHQAFSKFLQLGKPFLRPPDYYAEMVKSDTHMLKIKDSLLSQQKQMEEAEERRKAREAKRFSKEVQAQKLKQRAQEKKQNIESVKKWRKMRQDGGFSGGEDKFPFDSNEDNDNARGMKKRKFSSNFETPSKKYKGSGGKSALDNSQFGEGGGEKGNYGRRSSFPSAQMGNRTPARGDGSSFASAQKGSRTPAAGDRSRFASAQQGNRTPPPWDRSGGKGGSNKKSSHKAFQKRQARNAKYGHGGRKGLKKSNTAESSAGFFRKKRKA